MSVQGAVAKDLGVRFRVEGTGGGCTALTARLEGGLVLVLVDDNLGTDLDTSSYVSVGVYTVDSWGDGNEALSDAVVNADYVLDDGGGEIPSMPAARVVAAVRVALGAAVAR